MQVPDEARLYEIGDGMYLAPITAPSGQVTARCLVALEFPEKDSAIKFIMDMIAADKD